MEIITGFLATAAGKWVIAAITAAVGGSILKWILGKFPTEDIKKAFGKFMYGAGKVCTLNIANWPYIGKVWNTTIEPWFIVVIQGIVSHGLNEFVKGLQSDNKK